VNATVPAEQSLSTGRTAGGVTVTVVFAVEECPAVSVTVTVTE
jgi:hypothetical protein